MEQAMQQQATLESMKLIGLWKELNFSCVSKTFICIEQLHFVVWLENSLAFELQNVAQIFWINFKDAFAAMHGYDKTVKCIFYHFIGKKVWN